jgi:hypothetical protein
MPAEYAAGKFRTFTIKRPIPTPMIPKEYFYAKSFSAYSVKLLPDHGRRVNRIPLRVFIELTPESFALLGSSWCA